MLQLCFQDIRRQLLCVVVSVLVGHTSHFLWELQPRNAPCGNQPAADVCVCQTQTKQQPPGMKTDAEVI